MNTETPAPDHGEPWSEQSPPHPITKDKGVYWLNPEQFNRAVTCVNACAGISDPAAHLAAMKEAIREAHSALNNAAGKLANPYGICQDQTADEYAAVLDCEAALIKLQPFLK